MTCCASFSGSAGPEMSTTAEQLARIERAMAVCEELHTQSMQRWRRLRVQREYLRLAVEREDAALDKQARKYLGPDVRRSA